MNKCHRDKQRSFKSRKPGKDTKQIIGARYVDHNIIRSRFPETVQGMLSDAKLGNS